MPKEFAYPTYSSVGPLFFSPPHPGYVFVDFTSEEEVQKALKQNKEYMGEACLLLITTTHNRCCNAELTPFAGKVVGKARLILF